MVHISSSVQPRLHVALLFTLLVMSGCKFKEPEPSADIYLGGVAPGQLGKRSATAPDAQVENELKRLAANAPDERGFVLESSGERVYFKPPSSLYRVLEDGRIRYTQNGRCYSGWTQVGFPCDAADAQWLDAEVLAAQILYGRSLNELSPSSVKDGLQFKNARGTEVVAAISKQGVDTLEYRGQRVFEGALRIGRFRGLAESEWIDATAIPKPGTHRRVAVPRQSLVCVPHAGGISAIGPSVRKARDKATGSSLTIDDRMGVVIRDRVQAQSVCVGVDGDAPDVTVFQARDVWRSWHRGEYSGLTAVREAGRLAATQKGEQLSSECVTTLYHDPSATKAGDRISHIDCLVLK